MIITILRGVTTIAQVEIDETTIYQKKLMGEHKIISDFYAASPLNIQLGDHIVYDSENFYVNRAPQLEKINSQTYKYSVEFESELYTLNNKLFLYDGLSEFDYTGAPVDFLTLIVAQINLINPGWTMGDVDTLEEKNISFSNVNCRQALSIVAEEFKLEYDIAVKVISLKSNVSASSAIVFEYGRGGGLYKLTRKQVSDQNIITRVYGFGGSTNIASDYRNRAKKLIFNSRYLESNVNLYGVIEGVFNDETIYPKRTGTITGVHVEYDGEGVYNPNTSYVVDSSIEEDFDINDFTVAGQTATIIFKSGNLSGYKFEIWKYEHATRRIYLKLFEESDGYVLPNSLNLPEASNTYTLVNISMPQTYIDAAETALHAATQTYINQNSVPQVTYELDIDPKFIKTNSISLKVGYLINIYDSALGIDSTIRVMDIEFPLVNPNKIRATISDTVLYTTSERVILSTVKNTQNIVKTKKQSVELARRNAATFKNLEGYLLDADNEFSQDLISADRIKALLAEFGTSSGNFLLNPVPTFIDNYGGNANSFLAPACTLTHLEISILLLGIPSYAWIISQRIFSSLTPATAYYLYAKCSKTAGTATWELSSSVIPSDQTGFYYFPAGILLPVDGTTLVRVFITSYGKTYINGREITTGKIQSISGDTYFDLDNNTIVMGGSSITDVKGIADAATTAISNISSDTILSKGEKPLAIREFNTLSNEQAAIDTEADRWNITTEKTAYDDALLQLSQYLGHGIYQWTNVAIDSVIVAATWESYWRTVYEKRQILLNKIFALASAKKKHFTTTPTTPYAVGDTWSNGTVLKVCQTALATGSYNAAHWVNATTYDNTQDAFNSGIIAGYIAGLTINNGSLTFATANQLAALSNIEIISANAYHGRGLSFYTGAAALSAGMVKVVGIGQLRNRDTANVFGATPEYGFEIIQAVDNLAPGVYKHLIRLGGATNIIAGWNIDFEAIFSGPQSAKVSSGYTSGAGQMTIHNNGSIHAKNFYLNADGSVAAKNILLEFAQLTSEDVEESGINMRLAMDGNGIWENLHDGDNSNVDINRKGYNNGTTRYRTLRIFGGRGGVPMATFAGGATNEITHYDNTTLRKKLALVPVNITSTTPYNATSSNCVIEVATLTGTGTINLPSAPVDGQIIMIHNMQGSYSVVINSTLQIVNNGALVNSVTIGVYRSTTFQFISGAGAVNRWVLTAYR